MSASFAEFPDFDDQRRTDGRSEREELEEEEELVDEEVVEEEEKDRGEVKDEQNEVRKSLTSCFSPSFSY